MIFFYTFTVPLFQVYLGNFSVAEIISIIFIVYAASKSKFTKPDRSDLYLLFFIIIIAFSYFIINGRGYFFPSSFFNNLIRLSFYTLGFYFVPRFFVKNNNFEKMIKTLALITIIISISGIIEFFTKRYAGVGIPIINSIGSVYAFKSFRPTSVFSEPAHFAIFVGVSSGLILESEIFFRNKMKFTWIFYIFLLALLLSFSLIGYAFALILLIIKLRNGLKSSKGGSKNLLRVLSILSVFVVLFMFLSQFTIFKQIISDRVTEILNLQDLSGQHRILGSWELATYGASKFPLFGVGLGQSLPFLRGTPTSFQYFYFGSNSQGSGINNIFALIIFQTGYLSFSLFMIFIFRFFKFDKYLLVLFIIFSLSWGFFDISFFWFFLYTVKSYSLLYKQKFKDLNA